MEATKAFYSAVFGWEFVDYGPEYASFSEGHIDGGFSVARDPAPIGSGTLIVFYAKDIEQAIERVKANGGTISTELFDFPGGRRFHFVDPSGNELAVWTEPAPESP